MKVPKYVKEAILKCSKYNAKATKYENIVRDWLNSNNLSDETAMNTARNMTDSFIDSCCYGNDEGIEFIKQLEELEE